MRGDIDAYTMAISRRRRRKKKRGKSQTQCFFLSYSWYAQGFKLTIELTRQAAVLCRHREAIRSGIRKALIETLIN